MRFLLALTAAFCLASAEPAFACGCIGVPTPPTVEDYRKRLNSFDGVVFRGTLVESEIVPGLGTKVTFRVERHWKGVASPEMSVHTYSGTSCAVGYVLGPSYLIVARREKNGLADAQGVPFTSPCLNEYYLGNEEAFLAALGAGSLPPR
jgi:hypothetical protein